MDHGVGTGKVLRDILGGGFAPLVDHVVVPYLWEGLSPCQLGKALLEYVNKYVLLRVARPGEVRQAWTVVRFYSSNLTNNRDAMYLEFAVEDLSLGLLMTPCEACAGTVVPEPVFAQETLWYTRCRWAPCDKCKARLYMGSGVLAWPHKPIDSISLEVLDVAETRP